jgi:putative GTP pyrophosphokinase
MTKQIKFISEYEISKEQWEKASISEQQLRAIEDDFTQKATELRHSAEFFASSLQSFPSIHSVRWRTKDPKHLVRKIVRKRAEGVEKYKDITPENYRRIVTDLIGVRAMHLFKEDLSKIDEHIRSNWEIRETPTIYIREGDPPGATIGQPHEVKVHSFGYRSAHYLVESRPTKEPVIVELQIRTIFEEGWSEIDHNLRYPDHTDNQDIQSILTLLNRVAGSADEIASFTLRLKNSIESSNQQLALYREAAENYKTERDSFYKQIESLLGELSKQKTHNSELSKIATNLQSQLTTMKAADSRLIPPTETKTGATSQANNQAGLLIAAFAALALLSSK